MKFKAVLLNIFPLQRTLWCDHDYKRGSNLKRLAGCVLFLPLSLASSHTCGTATLDCTPGLKHDKFCSKCSPSPALCTGLPGFTWSAACHRLTHKVLHWFPVVLSLLWGPQGWESLFCSLIDPKSKCCSRRKVGSINIAWENNHVNG